MAGLTAAVVEQTLGRALNAVDSILARRRKREESIRADTVDDLEALGEIVKTLDNLALNLLAGFQDPGVIDDPARLEAHVAATRSYLMSNELRPTLVGLDGQLVDRAERTPRGLQKVAGFAPAVEALHDHVEQFINGLGWSASTGVMRPELEELCRRGDARRAEGGPAADILDFAQQAGESYDRLRSDRIVSQVKVLSGRLHPGA